MKFTEYNIDGTIISFGSERNPKLRETDSIKILENVWPTDISTQKVVNGEIVNKADAEDILLAKQWLKVRSKRTSLLAATDYTQLADVTVDKNAWSIYRQALRDITDQDDPYNIIWPTKPT